MSTAERNAVAIISLCCGFAFKIREAYKTRNTRGDLLKLADKLGAACDAAFKQWDQPLTPREIAVIHNKLQEWEGKNLEKEYDPCLVSSITLGLLDDLLQNLKHEGRRKAIEEIESVLIRVHKYWDSRLSGRGAEEASVAIDQWRRIVA